MELPSENKLRKMKSYTPSRFIGKKIWIRDKNERYVVIIDERMASRICAGIKRMAERLEE